MASVFEKDEINIHGKKLPNFWILKAPPQLSDIPGVSF
jgi:hypothetical protein